MISKRAGVFCAEICFNRSSGTLPTGPLPSFRGVEIPEKSRFWKSPSLWHTVGPLPTGDVGVVCDGTSKVQLLDDTKLDFALVRKCHRIDHFIVLYIRLEP